MNFDNLKSLSAEEAIKRLDSHLSLHPDDDAALLQRGIRHWALSHRSAAINDYLAAIRLNPESQAVQALEVAQKILSFYNKDLYNP